MAGLTLVELLVTMAVGLIVVLAASALLVSSRSGYLLQADTAQMLDTGRYAMEIVARTVRQAGLEDWDGPADAGEAPEPGIRGLDARSLKGSAAGIEAPVAKSVNGSDVLAIHFSGSGKGDDGDGSVLNCAGFGVGAPAAGAPDRGWSIFYVAQDATGEPELYCKFRGGDGWSAQAIARGVESFQVLYALDTDGDGAPDTVLNASEIDARDAALTQSGRTAAERQADLRGKSWWRKVVAVKVALLVRGAQPFAGDKSADRYDLFGKAYSDAYMARDPGVRIQVSSLPKAVRGNVRRTFGATIYVRNRQPD